MLYIYIYIYIQFFKVDKMCNMGETCVHDYTYIADYTFLC